MQRYRLRTEKRSPTTLRLDELNEQQRAVVTSGEGVSLVIAGAGTGKTRTLTYRAAHLFGGGLDPRRLLLCTFTHRAAREMLQRIEALVAIPTRGMWAGTFHHVANLALRRYAQLLGLAENYTILDREDARDLMSACLAEEGKKLAQRRFPSPALLLKIASTAINSEVPVCRAVELCAPRFAALSDDVQRVVLRYSSRKIKLALVDYDDLLLYFKLLLTEHPQAAAELTQQFEQVLVDEFQDTNRLQGQIVDLCAGAHGNLMVVGDDAQSIYGFRGADYRNIIEFEKRHPKTRIFRLERNYRCSPEVLRLANRSIAHNVRQYPKHLTPVRPSAMMPALIALYDAQQQAEFVSQRVLELSQQEQVPLSRIAVLYRTHAQSVELQVELSRRGIPYSVQSGLRFFEQAHIKDVLSYLRLVHNSADEIAWRRVLRLWSGVGPKTADRIVASATNSPTAPAETLADSRVAARLGSQARGTLGRLADLLRQVEGEARPEKIVRLLVDKHYREYAEASYANAKTRIEDLLQLAELSQRYQSLSRFLSEVALVASVTAEGIASGPPPEQRLTLSTVHQAKGLEWQAVFVLGLFEGGFPQAIGAQTRDAIEEERRLFYVAVTRAKEQIYLCRPQYAETADGAKRLLRLSRFLAELSQPSAPYERWQIDEVSAEDDALMAAHADDPPLSPACTAQTGA